MDRRGYVKYLGSGVIVVAGATVGAYYYRPTLITTSIETRTHTKTVTQTIPKTTTKTVSSSASLRRVAEAGGLLVGAAVSSEAFISPGYETYLDVLAQEFNYMTPENAMKWGIIHPTPDNWDFVVADKIVQFASAHQIKVKGHTLVWDSPLAYQGGKVPLWIKTLSPKRLREAMLNHIQTLMDRYKGKVHAWDVVNEAVDNHGRLKKGVFSDKLGEGYIAEAFWKAHEVDPDAVLIYNEYGAEGLSGKSDGVYMLVRKLVDDGVPIHGIGLQMHIRAVDYPHPNDILVNIRRFAELGLQVNISEMDVQIKDVRGDLPYRLEIQRRVYHDVIAACCKEKEFTAVTFWGFTDAHSWIDYFIAPDDPLLFDENYKRKPAYWGVFEALRTRVLLSDLL